jgi:hypothetical protein
MGRLIRRADERKGIPKGRATGAGRSSISSTRSLLVDPFLILTILLVEIEGVKSVHFCGYD